jgi:pyruvate formate lyase activating enzyme
LRQLVMACNRLDIDTAVETCGQFDWEQGKDICQLLGCVFVDCKQMDDEVHKRLTGVGNRRILENIALISKVNPNTVVRVPLIAEVNANERNIRELCRFLKQNTRVAKVELLPYHDFGESKYNAVGRIGQSFSAPDAAKTEEIKRIITDYGLQIVDFK